MNKDVIYIDTEDDITAIIGKIKASHEKIVALVPPKRIGVLQSAVNLRLLARMAETAHKHLVLVTNNRALIALSAVAMIPVAKNLQSKPEIVEVAEIETNDDDDVIDGVQLPVGDLAKTADIRQGDDMSDAIETLDIENEMSRSAVSAKPFVKSGVKVPNFSSFRKKLFIGIFAAILLVIFFVWAIIYAPSAKVIITAKTEPSPISMTLKLGGAAATDISKNIVQTVVKQTKKDVSVDFTATGQKDLGEKAKGTIEVTRTSVSNSSLTVPAGTAFTNTGCTFLSAAAVVLAPTQVGQDGFIQDSATINVVSADPGVGCNLSARSYQPSMLGVAADGGVMTGGTTKMTTVVTAEDVQKASQALVDLPSVDVKAQLIKQFYNGEIVVSDSFNIDRAAAVSIPAIGAEATGKAKLTSLATYSLTAIAKLEMQAFLKDALSKQIAGNKQRIYDDGVDKLKMSGYLKTDQMATVNITAIGQVGPNIDSASIKEQVKGKKYGDIQTLIGSIKGVNNVDTKFSYFWVNTVPNDITKIDVEFRLENA
jgi:hypothetical protein